MYRIVIGNLHDFPLHRQLESMDLMAIIHKKCIAEWNDIKAHLLFRSLRVLLTLCSPWKLIIISINYGIPSAADRKTFWLPHLLGCGRNASSVCQFFQMVIFHIKIHQIVTNSLPSLPSSHSKANIRGMEIKIQFCIINVIGNYCDYGDWNHFARDGATQVPKAFNCLQLS